MADQKQKVIIPKGLVNPNDTTIIEIPGAFRNCGVVVAKTKHPNEYSYDSSSPEYTPPPQRVKKRTYRRRSHPPLRPGPSVSPAGYTFGGRDWADPADESSHGFHPYVPHSPYSPDVSYRQFLPTAQSTMGDLDYSEGSLYRDFRPKHHATHHGRSQSPGYTPPSMDSYKSPSKITKKTSVTKTTPEEFELEEISEEWSPPSDSQTPSDMDAYYARLEEKVERRQARAAAKAAARGIAPPAPAIQISPPSFESSGSPVAGYGSSGFSNVSPGSYYSSGPASGLSSGGGGSSGAYCAGSPISYGSPNLSQDDMMNSLSHLEKSETDQIMGDLSDYQNARRKLIFDTSSLATAADVSSEMLNSSGSGGGAVGGAHSF